MGLFGAGGGTDIGLHHICSLRYLRYTTGGKSGTQPSVNRTLGFVMM